MISIIHDPMSDGSRLTLFASLRRDRLLFAVVGALMLLLHSLQPLSAAFMPESMHLVICTINGLEDRSAAPGETPVNPLDNCPVCLISGGCSGFASVKAVLDTAYFFTKPDIIITQTAPLVATTGPVGRQGEPSPAIRAPPLST